MQSSFFSHFKNPHNAGEMPAADGRGRAGDTGCGVDISFFIRFDGEAIGAASFTATGSSAAIVAGSLLTDMICGRHWQEAAALPASGLESAIRSLRADGSSPNTIENAARFAIEALHGALEDSLRRGAFPWRQTMTVIPCSWP